MWPTDLLSATKCGRAPRDCARLKQRRGRYDSSVERCTFQIEPPGAFEIGYDEFR